jgi:hypothetical protein
MSMGLVWVIKDSYVLSLPRNYLNSKSIWIKELISCSQCLGFWVGVSFSIIDFYFFNFNLIILSYPFAVSAFCWFFDSLLDLIQEASAYLEKVRGRNK